MKFTIIVIGSLLGTQWLWDSEKNWHKNINIRTTLDKQICYTDMIRMEIKFNNMRVNVNISHHEGIVIGYHGMILVSHSYRVRNTRIVPFRTSYRTLPTSYRTSRESAIWCRKGAIRCTKLCDTSVYDPIRVRYKNHTMISYNYH